MPPQLSRDLFAYEAVDGRAWSPPSMARTLRLRAGTGSAVYGPALMQRYLAMGFRLVLAGSDLSFMPGAAKEPAAAVRR